MVRLRRGSLNKESAPLPPKARHDQAGPLPIINSFSKRERQVTEDCSSDRTNCESEWHVSIQKKDWASLQRYLEQVAAPISAEPATGQQQSPQPQSSEPPSILSPKLAHGSANGNNTSNSTMSVTFSRESSVNKKKTKTKKSLSLHRIFMRSLGSSMRDSRWKSQPHTGAGAGSSDLQRIQKDDSNDATKGSDHQRHHKSIPPKMRLDKESLLITNAAGRTPLQVAINAPETPDTMLIQLLRAQPQAISVVDGRGRLPLHFAVVRKRRMETLMELVASYPDALHHADQKGKTPVAYSIEMAKRQTNLEDAPNQFWAAGANNNPSSPQGQWQQRQQKEWEMALWLLQKSSLLSTAISASLSTSTQQPLLIDAMIHAAPPTVVSLLITASSSLLRSSATLSSSSSSVSSTSTDLSDQEFLREQQQQGISLGCSAMYLAIFRQYPLSIVQQLGSLLADCQPVKTVRDETGLGLVSAHYVTSCFEKSKLLEYVATEDFMVTVEQCIVQGQLPSPPQENTFFLEWWEKLKYLIFFCADKDPEDTPDDCLLHAALENTDTPPNVIRLLLAIYPGSARQPDAQSAHPLHLFAMHRDYIPRNYESPYMHGLNVMDMLLSLDESAAFHHFRNRLPIHHAIAAGRTWSTIYPLVSSYRASLRIPDPITKLYPSQLAAVYWNEDPEAEEVRLLQLTRNQYSAIVWQGLSKKQQEKSVNRIRHSEDLKHLDTIFELLRRFPQCVETAVVPSKDIKNSSHRDIVVEKLSEKSSSNRRRTTATDAIFQQPQSQRQETSGPEMIAFHYLSWCYKKANGKWRVVEENMQILQLNIQEASQHGVLSKKSADFVNWWGMMKLYFWHCYNAMESSKKIGIPLHDNFLLHVAVSLSTTPPDLVQLILGLFPESASRPLPDSKTLPLHLACNTVRYTPQYFEVLERPSTIELLLEAFPEAVFVRSGDGELPLHMAIKAGKTIDELHPIIDAGPSLIAANDPVTGLFPFQLMALSKTPSNELRLRLQTIASNRSGELWNDFARQRKLKEIRVVENEYQTRVFNSIFELLRLKPSAIARSRNQQDVNEGDAVDQKEETPQNTRKKASTLRRLLSGLSVDKSIGGGGGGGSAFSTIDMMSTISNVSNHLSFGRSRSISESKLSRSLLGDDFGGDDDESEASDIWSEDSSFHSDYEEEVKVPTNSRPRPRPRPQTSKIETPSKALRQQKLKAKWEAPQHFVETASSHSGSVSHRDIPTEIAPLESGDEVSFLDGIDPRSRSFRANSELKTSMLAETIDDDDQQESSTQADNSQSVESDSSTSGSFGSSDHDKLSRQKHDSDGIASSEESSTSTDNSYSKPESMEKAAPVTPKTEEIDDNDSIQDEIVPKAGQSVAEDEAPVVFRLRRRNCQRQFGGGAIRLKQTGTKSLGGSQRSGSSLDMDFLTILNASLPEGKMDYLSTLEASARSLPPGPYSMPIGLDGAGTKVDRMAQIKEFPNDSEPGIKISRKYTGGLGALTDNSSRHTPFEDSASTLHANSGVSKIRRRSFDQIGVTGSIHSRGGTPTTSRGTDAKPLVSPQSSKSSFLQTPINSPSPSSSKRLSSLEISPMTCNYIGVKPERLKSCLNCGKHAREVLMLPCSHLCLCRVCSEEVEIMSCPICFGPVADQKVVS